jgi:hypothetical protein
MKDLPSEERDFGFESKNIYSMKNAIKTDTIEFPSDSILTCQFGYDDPAWNEKINTTLLIRVREYKSFELNDGKIQPYPVAPGVGLFDNILTVKRGFMA